MCFYGAVIGLLQDQRFVIYMELKVCYKHHNSTINATWDKRQGRPCVYLLLSKISPFSLLPFYLSSLSLIPDFPLPGYSHSSMSNWNGQAKVSISIVCESLFSALNASRIRVHDLLMVLGYAL